MYVCDDKRFFSFYAFLHIYYNIIRVCKKKKQSRVNNNIVFIASKLNIKYKRTFIISIKNISPVAYQVWGEHYSTIIQTVFFFFFYGMSLIMCFSFSRQPVVVLFPNKIFSPIFENINIL